MGNLKFFVRKGDAGIAGNIFLGLYEVYESSFLIHFLRETDLFLDVGANVGHYSLLAAGIKGAYTISIEPVPDNFEQLKRQIDLNNLSHTIMALNIGVGNSRGDLYFSTDRGTMNHVVGNAYGNSVRIPVKTLDEISTGRIINILKIDVEGYEKFVLEGSGILLKQEELKVIIIELNNSGSRYGIEDEEIVEILNKHNFFPYQYDPFRRKLEPLQVYNATQFNTLFIRDINAVRERIRKSISFKVWDIEL